MTIEERIERYNALPLYKRLFTKYIIMEQIDKTIEILKAFKEGKTIEACTFGGVWVDATKDDVLDISVRGSKYYRIKSQSASRPYANAEEFMKASKEHGPYLQRMRNAVFRMPVTIGDATINFDDGTFASYMELFKDGKWQDGSMCGISENKTIYNNTYATYNTYDPTDGIITEFEDVEEEE